MPKYNSRLKAAIKESGRMQWWVAEQAGITEYVLSRIGNGRHEPSEEVKRDIAKALDVTIKSIFCCTEPK